MIIVTINDQRFAITGLSDADIRRVQREGRT